MSEPTIISDPSALDTEDLVDEYKKISYFYCKLKDNNEKCEQEMFQLKRNLELSEKRENYLCQEIESLTESHERELTAMKNKYDMETYDLRTQLTNVEQANGELECEIDRLKVERVELEIGSKTKGACECSTKANESLLSNSRFEYLETLENDRTRMLLDMDELKEKLIDSMQCRARNETELENVKDCLQCSQENLRAKNEELDEKSQIIDSLQEKIVELNVELAEFQSGNNEPKKKGNSLFAEVDDQRQHMKQILSQQKQQYLKMKREHQEGQLKIRRLQRENADMHREVQQCSQMLQNANHYYKKSLNDTIGFLESEVSKLRGKLQLTESRLIALARENKVTWLESMLEYCRKETETLKDQHYATRLQKCEAERFYFESQEQAAKWRFEALKSRCIIVDREMLLEQNGISFGPLAKIGNIVEKLCQENEQELPNISHEIPLTHLSGELVGAASTIGALNDETVLESVQIEEHIAKEIRMTALSNIHSNEPNANVYNMSPLRISTECVSSTEDIKSVRTIRYDSPIKLETESNKENQNSCRDAKSSVSTLSTIVPQFQPITISSERMKVLSQSIVESNADDKESSNQKIVSKCRPKVVVKHIVLKRE